MPSGGHNEIKLDEKEIIRLYLEEKLTIQDICKLLNVNYGTIKKRLVKNNVVLRTTSESKKIVMNRPEVKKNVSEASKRSSEKRMQTNIEKYGAKVASNNYQKRKEWEENYFKTHGVEWNKDPQRLQKTIETNLQKYGVENVSQTSENKEKIKQNRWENKTEEELVAIHEKTVETWKNNLGVDNPLKNETIKEKVVEKRWTNKTEEELKLIQEKTVETNYKKFGFDNPTKNEIIRKKISSTRRSNFLKVYLPKLLTQLNLNILETWTHAHENYTFKCTKCGTEFIQTWNDVQQGYKCPTCFPRMAGESLQEIDLYNFIKGIYNGEILRNDRSIIPPKELDLFLPEINIAIEFNGLFYHSDAVCTNPKEYHLNKTIECHNKGIRLIHIFEDEWILKQEIVKARIKNIIGIKSTTRIHARKCSIKEIIPQQKDVFLDTFHIQGKDISHIKLGAFFNEQLIAVMTFGKGNIAKGSVSQEGVWELNRFCSDYNYSIPGIASKLLSHFEKNYEWKQIFSYADRRWSEGNLYEKIGFNLNGFTKPNYWYIKGAQRIYRFNLRKRPDEPKDIPEWVLRQAEGYTRIWDCGHYKFSKLKGI